MVMEHGWLTLFRDLVSNRIGGSAGLYLNFLFIGEHSKDERPPDLFGQSHCSKV